MSDRILVVRGGALGDFVLGIPALDALRAAFPEASIELIAPGALLPLATPLVDTVTPLERAEVAPLFGEAERLPDHVAARYRDLDLVVLWLSDAEGTVRRNFQRLGARRILRAPAFPSRPGHHVADHLLDTLRPLGICLDLGATGQSPLRPRPAARKRVVDVMEQYRPVVAIHPGSGGSWKCWPPDRFAEVVDRLGSSGAQVVLIQGPADEAAVGKVLASVVGAKPGVVADLEVEELAACLALCSCYLGNDSGVSHLAAALGVPTVAIFGPTDPAVWGPRGPHVVVLQGEQQCAPCARETALRCQTRACVRDISVEQIIATVASLCRSRHTAHEITG